MITLITGTPGTGKTALTVSLLLNEPEYKDRLIYQHGIVDFKIESEYIYCHSTTCKVCQKLTQDEKNKLKSVNTWNEWVPDGSLIILDEVQKIYRPTNASSKVTSDLQAFEDHRHNGIDFIIVTQSPKLVNTNLRALVNRHIHIVAGWAGRWRYQWDEISDNVQSRAGAVKKRHTLDKKTYSLYKSATTHTNLKRSLPPAAYVFMVMMVVVIFGGYKLYQKLSGDSDGKTEISKNDKKQNNKYIAVKSNQASFDFVPVVDNVPESAPVYSKIRKVKTFPYLAACIRSKNKCKCYNQQGTVYPATLKQCLDYVRSPSFNPYYENTKRSQGTKKQTNSKKVTSL